MYKFGKNSMKHYNTLHPKLQEVLDIAIQYVDFSIVDGHRSKEIQDHYYESGKSKVKFPDSKHNAKPSLAVDLVPYPEMWSDLDKLQSLAYFIKGIGAAKGYNLRLGCDWNNNFKTQDENFLDYPHIEILNP